MEKEAFRYTYSAKEQVEIQNIRQKYLPREMDGMERLRKLDQSAARKGMLLSVTVGVIGALLLGVGMCATMVWAGVWFVPGIVIGILGIAMICLAYPLFWHITQKERKKIAPEILRLADELMKNT